LFCPYSTCSPLIFDIFGLVEEEQSTKPDRQKTELFEREFMPHLEALYNFAFKLTFNEDDAKDLLQDTSMKAYRFIHSFAQGTNAKAWLFRIMKNSFINDYRKKSKAPGMVDYQEVEAYYDSGKGTSPRDITVDLRAETVRDKLGDEVTLALNSLTVDFRTVIILCDLEGFKYDEMAKILDIPIGTVRSRLHRARNMLKAKLAAYAAQMGYK